MNQQPTRVLGVRLTPTGLVRCSYDDAGREAHLSGKVAAALMLKRTGSAADPAQH